MYFLEFYVRFALLALYQWMVKMFSHSVGCCFVLLKEFFALQKTFSFTSYHLFLIVDLSALVNSSVQEVVSCDYDSRVIPHFLFNQVSVSLPLLHCVLSFVHGVKHGSIFILTHSGIQFEQHHLWTTISFYGCIFLDFFKRNQVSLGVRFYFISVSLI